jgi:hypothetical protein
MIIISKHSEIMWTDRNILSIEDAEFLKITAVGKAKVCKKIGPQLNPGYFEFVKPD